MPPSFISPRSSYASYDSFTVNIPNNSGGYTNLEIKKSANGYVGPKGEYYPDFPTVPELQQTYNQQPDYVIRERMIREKANEEVQYQLQK